VYGDGVAQFEVIQHFVDDGPADAVVPIHPGERQTGLLACLIGKLTRLILDLDHDAQGAVLKAAVPEVARAEHRVTEVEAGVGVGIVLLAPNQ
jgi:hypothetical protein